MASWAEGMAVCGGHRVVASWTETPVHPKPRSKPRVYVCGICGKACGADGTVYSRWTRQRFHPTCIWKEKKS